MKMASASGASTRGPLRRLLRQRRRQTRQGSFAIVDNIRMVLIQSVTRRMGAVHAGTIVKSGARHEAAATTLARQLTIAGTTNA